MTNDQAKQGGEADADAEPTALAPDLTTRIGSILQSVQRQADELIEDARAEAQRLATPGRPGDPIDERRRELAALSDRLVESSERVLGQLEEAELVRDSFGRLMRALSDAADRLTEELGESPRDRPEPR